MATTLAGRAEDAGSAVVEAMNMSSVTGRTVAQQSKRQPHREVGSSMPSINSVTELATLFGFDGRSQQSS